MKKLSVVIVCLALVLAGAGCSKAAEYIISRSGGSIREETDAGADYSIEDSAVQTDAEEGYTNAYLGFSYTVPKSWWMYGINEANFDPDPQTTESPDILDISYGEDEGMSYSYIPLMSIANLRDSRRDNHIGFDLSAETLEGVHSIGEYMDYLEIYMLKPDENEYRLLDSGREEINGLQYEMRKFEVMREESNYLYITYTRPVNNNYYLTIKASYWPHNRNAETFIANALSKAMP